MHTLESLSQDIASLQIPRDSAVLIHSSYKSLGPVAGGPTTVIQALEDYFAPGLLVMPTHTWAVVNAEQPVFDVETTSSNVGILGELFRKRPQVHRSLHPTHSLAAKGRDAREFVADEHTCTTPTSRHGAYGKLYDAGAYVVFLGVPLTKNTLIHAAEEWAGVPHRHAEHATEYIVRNADGHEMSMPVRGHDCPVADLISDNYGKLTEPFLKREIGWQGQVADAVTTVCQVAPMLDFTMELLGQHPDILLTPDPLPRHTWEAIP